MCTSLASALILLFCRSEPTLLHLGQRLDISKDRAEPQQVFTHITSYCVYLLGVKWWVIMKWHCLLLTLKMKLRHHWAALFSANELLEILNILNYSNLQRSTCHIIGCLHGLSVNSALLWSIAIRQFGTWVMILECAVNTNKGVSVSRRVRGFELKCLEVNKQKACGPVSLLQEETTDEFKSELSLVFLETGFYS